jgi:hypothetical protein
MALDTNHPLRWEQVVALCDGEQLTYSVQDSKAITWTISHINGLIHMTTQRCEYYWKQQIKLGRTVPDWKINFSISYDDISTAWNILAHVFINFCG